MKIIKNIKISESGNFSCKRHHRNVLALLAGLLMLSPAGGSLYYAEKLADQYSVRRGESLTLDTVLPIKAVPTASNATAVTNNPGRNTTISGYTNSYQLRLFSCFPVKQVQLQTVDSVMLIPCGQPFGVRMLMDGIMVIGFGEVASPAGGCCPAVETGILEGDMIKEINHEVITCTDDFKNAVAQSEGNPLEVTVQREEEILELTLSPEYSVMERCWQTGLWVRDSTAGIGTLTYYEPESGAFGGLGHPICDADTGEFIPLGSGVADSVTISGAIKGQAGIPGQLQGYFSAEESIGTLDYNSKCGVFGHLNLPENSENFLSGKDPVPMGLKQEITLGDAVILTTVQGTEPEEYTIRITALDYSDDTQNMIIEVTDERLLNLTGGIVQGMSGSPILQNGKLIGAVTHVFVSQPAMGYGIFAENMYEYTQSSN
ncbi:MAG: SpoIVB peptidase [Oscillospiraceae bacterium]|nr:SpoIVB peptidase [Oscillospiraceae bacterium]